MNKDSNSIQIKNRAITPDSAAKALASLPHDFVKKTKVELERQGKQVYSATYISKVKNGKLYNEDIFDALVAVGSANGESIQKAEIFNQINKKTPAA